MKHRRISMIVLQLILLAALIVFLLPFYIIVLSAFKNAQEAMASPLGLPHKVTLDNFVYIVSKTKFLSAFRNTAAITFSTVVLNVFLGSAASYAIERRKSKWNRWVYLYLLSGMMIPFQVTSIPVVKLLLRLKLYGTFPGLVLTYLGLFLPMVVFLYCGFIKSIPKELDESAIIDGCNPFLLYARIIMPLLKPCTGAVIIFIGLFSYNDFFTPLLLLSSSSGETLYLAVFRLVDRYRSMWNYIFAGVLMGSLPILALFVVLQRNFIKGLTMGSVKG